MNPPKSERNARIARRILVDRDTVSSVARDFGLNPGTAREVLAAHCRRVAPELFARLSVAGYGPHVVSLRSHASAFVGEVGRG